MKKKSPTIPDQNETDIPSQEIDIPEAMPAPQDVAAPDVAQPHFPIIGIGASAGGLEALELFLKNVPSDSGMAFVIVQHLDPTHKGMMAELLQRATKMPVMQVTDRLKVEPDSVYIIPPNKDMSMLHGVLHLLPPVAPRGLRLPIDFFFRSLADDLREHSVGVILSGMGSDGTLGLRALKEKAGAVFVQEPDTAKFNGMPQSVIEAGLADVVAPVEELPARISAYVQRVPVHSGDDVPIPVKTQSTLEKIFIVLRSQTGHDFSQYKRSTIYRRVERRMGLHQIDKIGSYLQFLQKNPQETELLFKELLIGVTSFFRDPEAWAQLQKEVFPTLFKAHPAGGILRAWMPGCSTGEEAYSLAILFRETLEKVNPAGNYSLQIFATDLDHDAIEKARQGVFPANIAADVTPERLRRFFIQEEYGFRVGNEIREMVVFAQQNLVMDPPFTRLDLLVCRNLLIYLNPEVQKKLLPLFYYCLNPGGALFLGSAETIGTFTHLFVPLKGKMRLYWRRESNLNMDQVEFPPSFSAISARPSEDKLTKDKVARLAPSIQMLTDRMLLQNYAPAAVLVNRDGDILYVNGRTGKYLELAAGKVNWNIFAMAREGLRYELSSGFQKALREKKTVTIENLVIGTNGGTQTIDLILQPQLETNALQGTVLVVFDDVSALPAAKPTGKGKRSSGDAVYQDQLEKELQRAREEVQTIREEMQTSQEELKSTNEELQSTNEELQSTNEELTTSKEEMQSMNEELQTVNNELQSKVEDLSHINNDMKNLFNSTEIATLFLDEDLCVRRFTSQVTKIIKLIPGDAGRLLTDIVSDLDYPEIETDVREVLRTLVFVEKQIATRDGRWFTVRIMPYRTLDNRIDGVVITFINITIAKKLEAELRENEREMKALFEHMTNAFALFESVIDPDGSFLDCRFVFVNAAFERTAGMKNESVQGKLVSETWDVCGENWIKISRQVAETGKPARFTINNLPDGKPYNCNMYRPGESQSRVCMILNEIRD